MAKNITELTPAAALDGTELAWVEQGGEPVGATLQAIADLGGGGLADGTILDAMLRWNGSAWVESTAIQGNDTALTITAAGGEKLRLKGSGTGNTPVNFIGFDDSVNTRQGWMGFGSSTTDDLTIATDSAFGDVVLSPRNSAALRISNTLATFGVGLNITGAITLSGDINALSYEGILGFNLIDKTDTSVLISGAWRFTDFDLLLSNNIALTSIDPGGPTRNLIKIAATTGEVIVGDALNPMDLRATVVDIQAPVTAVSYNGILAANLVQKSTVSLKIDNFSGDMDTKKANEQFRVNSGATNQPTSGTFWAAQVWGNGSNVTGQMATHFVSGDTYFRGFNTAWSAWRKVIMANDANFTVAPLKSSLGIPYYVTSGFTGGRIFVQTTVPAGVKGDIWFDTS